MPYMTETYDILILKGLDTTRAFCCWVKTGGKSMANHGERARCFMLFFKVFPFTGKKRDVFRLVLTHLTTPHLFFSSPEPKAHRWAYRIPMVRRPSSSVVRPSVRSQFQKSSSLKPLGQSKPNFMWSFLGKGGTKVYINRPGRMTKVAAMPIYGKNLKKNLLLKNQKAEDLET